MTARRVARLVVVLVLLVGATVVLRSDILAARTTEKDLGGAERFLTHLSTDKPIYRPGEKVYIRGVLLHARDHTPLDEKSRVQAMVQIQGPKGDTVASGYAVSEDSVVAFHWPVPAEQPGGEYTIKVSYPWHGHPPAERKFDIRVYRAPRLKSQIVFLRDGYGPGDEVGATLHVERAEGGIPAGAKVTAIARVDGAEVHQGTTQVDAEGNCTARFKLPAEISRGEGTLAMVVEDGGIVETAAKTIPILLQTVDLALYPEGGDLVAGLPNRVYLEARTPAKKPADIAGEVLEMRVVGDTPVTTAKLEGVPVGRFRTEHEGRGRFVLTPRKGGKYILRITEPSGIKTTYPLPAVKNEGAIIRALEEVTPAGEPVRLRVGSTAGGKLTVTLSRREYEVSAVTWTATPGLLADVVLTPPAAVDGVLIATVWDAGGTALAERLVYREPARTLQVAITTDRTSYVPGGAASVTVKTTDGQGKPISAVVGITVADDSVLEMIEKREQAPRLPVMVLLESDVQELADAHLYLDKADPKAPLAVDLLLGTQGWRRFAFVDSARFVAEHGDKARRVLALRMASRREARHRWGGPGAERGGAPDQDGAVLADEVEGAARPADDLKKDVDKRGPVPKPAAPPKGVRPLAPVVDAEAHEKRKELGQALREADAKADRADLLAAEPAARPSIAGKLQATLVAVRVYAHAVRPDRKPNDRVDFAETLYWNAGIRTDAKTGEATVAFGLSDSVTTFRVFADAFGADGALGQGTGGVESVEPFYLEPKLPLAVTSGDEILLPLGVVNGIDSELADAKVTIEADGELSVAAPEPFDLGPRARVRRIVPIRVGHLNGATDFVIRATSGVYSDKVTRKLRVEPMGFPVEIALGGMTATNAAVSHTVVIPERVVPRSMTTNVAVYPTPLANLTEALARLIREPSGCFEQTSSTTYPLVMAQQYFLSHTGVDPALIERSRGLLDRGYQRLTSFECKQRGYEWFAGDPGHEALTAYGLLEFTDMAQVREVDANMLARTSEWLLKARDGEGGFSRKRRALHTWITDRDCSNAYILWALLESGRKEGLDAEIASLKAAAAQSKNSYVLALAANVMALAGEKAEATKLMDRLVAKQTKDGSVDGATASIVGSGGQALTIETASLAVLAWLRDPAYAGSVEKGIRYLAESCKAGRYGSTQSTVLALRAIVTYDKQRARPKAPGTVRVYVDGQPVGDPVPFDEKTQGAITLPDLSELLEPGQRTIELRMADGSAMPYSLAVNYNDVQPATAKECQVELAVALRDKEVDEGAVTEANVTVTNVADGSIPMTVAIVGLPGGLEPRHDQLKELVKAGTVDAYEVIGRDVVLYWREMKAGQKVQLPISCVAAVPGTYTGPASRAYLYYTDEFKCWVEGMRVAIRPRAQR